MLITGDQSENCVWKYKGELNPGGDWEERKGEPSWSTWPKRMNRERKPIRSQRQHRQIGRDRGQNTQGVLPRGWPLHVEEGMGGNGTVRAKPVHLSHCVQNPNTSSSGLIL